MDEAVEGSDMTNPTAWLFAWATCLVLAFALAWWITIAPEREREQQPIRVQLSWQRPTPEPLESFTFPPREFLRGTALAVKVLEAPSEPDPTPEHPELPLGRLVPLWLDVWTEQQQVHQRRRAAAAAAVGWPDPGYTYRGAHALAS
ncbi:hypothetical protein ABT095_15705 [Kitasatospora sp. NPDC002227]|uniref:hypothetical protein n=1 Tax=Kitasatospora sp. NPDC002227 TaxID=3154773 RepID=UPI0033325925